MTDRVVLSASRRPGRGAVKRRSFRVRRSMMPRSTSMNRTIQSPASVSATPTSSPVKASLMKTSSPPHLISPFDRTRRTA